MVKKLLKYELASYLRSLLPFQIILLGVALLHRFVQFFESDGTAYGIFSVSSTVIFVIACIVTTVATVALCISRFYKNLFTGEGYLSFTLPVTVHQHIAAKLIAVILCDAATVVAILLSCAIVTSGEALVEVFRAIGFLLDRGYQSLGGHFIAYIIEGVIYLIVLAAVQMLLFYACITIGQLAKKNRVLLAFGAYFAYYVICQILGTICIVIITLYGEQLGLDRLVNFFAENPEASGHIVLAALIVFSLILGAIYYLIAQHIMKKKLNLE